MYQDHSDAELIEELRTSNEEDKKVIFLTFYDRYKNLVLKISYQLLGDYDMAADVLHDVFVRVIQSVDGLKDGGVFKCWIITITRNRCADLLRRTSYLKNTEPLDPKIEVRFAERTEDIVVASLDRKKILELLSGCIKRLDDFHLNIFKLRWKGLKSAKISGCLGIDKAQLRRSYDRIKNVLEGCMQSKGFAVSIEQIISLGELDE